MQIDHKGPNLTFLTFKMTFRVTAHNLFLRTALTTGPQLGSVERCPSQTVVQVRHAQAQVCHIQFNTYLAKISSNGQILYLNCPGMDVLMYARYSQLYMQLNSP